MKNVLSLTALLLACAAYGDWYYAQMELELYRLESMKEECRLAGMIASHPGELPELRGSAQFRNRNKDADFTAVGPVGVKPTSDGWATWEKKPIQGAENFTATISTPHGTLEIKR